MYNTDGDRDEGTTEATMQSSAKTGRDLPFLVKLSKQRKSLLLGYLVVTKNKLVEEKDMEEAPPEEEDHNQDPQEELVLLADLSRSKCAQLR